MKNNRIHALLLTLVIFAFNGCSRENTTPSADAETKYTKDLFERWNNPARLQRIYFEFPATSMNKLLNDDYLKALKIRYMEHAKDLKPLHGMLESIFATSFDKKPEDVKFVLNETVVKNLSFLYDLLENDVPGFIDYLKFNGLESADLDNEERPDSSKVIQKYNGLLRMLFAHADFFKEHEYLFSIANRLFEFCFSPETWPQFKKILSDRSLHPVARFLYSNIWYYLAGLGWKMWNDQCLKDLKKEVDAGKTIIYIGAGSDFYQMLKRGIYNIEIIDPYYPSQLKWYAAGWDWFVRSNGIGDKIVLEFDDRTIELKREGFTDLGSTKAKFNTGEIGTVPLSKTRWGVYDSKTQQHLGKILIDRRFTNQDDYVMHKDKVFFISFNELYYLTESNPAKKWDVDIDQLPDDFEIYIKQLRRKIGKKEMLNMRSASAAPFTYIALGSQVT